MQTKRPLFFVIVFMILISLTLVACERPTPGRDNSGDGAADAGTEAVPEDAVTDPNAGGGVDGTDPAVQPASDQPAEAATDTQPAEETAETQPSEDATQDTAVTDETTEQPAEETTEQPAETTETGEAETTEQPAEETTEQPAETAETTEQPAQTTEQPTTHTVAAGENLYRIGLEYGVSWVKLAEYNNLANPNRIYVGQELKLTEGDNGSGGEPTPTPSPATESTYIVQAGDNLFRIGLNYGISWIQIAEANGLVNPNIIKVGDTLKIPVSAPGPSPQFTHHVQPGDTLFKISLQYGILWTSIATANDISAPYVIIPGQTLEIPGQ